MEKSLTHVSGVSSKNETTTLYGLPGDDVIDNEDIVTTATDLTKGDVVLVVQYGGRTYVEEPKTVTGEMELFNAKNKDDNKNYIKVGGGEYKQDGLEVLSNINKDNPVKFLISECDDKPTACSLTLSTTSSWTTSATSWPSVRSRALPPSTLWLWTPLTPSTA